MSIGLIANKAGLYLQPFGTIAAPAVNTDQVAIFTQPTVDALAYDEFGVPQYTGPELATLETWMTARLDDANWEEVCAIDVERDDTPDKIETNDRCTGGIKTGVPGDREQSITFDVWAKLDTATGNLPTWYTELETAIEYGKPVAVLMLDKKRTIAKARGVIGNYNVFSLAEAQPLNDGIKRSVEFAPTGCITNNPITRQIYRP